MKLNGGFTTVYKDVRNRSELVLRKRSARTPTAYDFVYPQTNYLVTRPDGTLFQSIAATFGDTARAQLRDVTREEDGVTEMVACIRFSRPTRQ
jgi:hypothetical protein